MLKHQDKTTLITHCFIWIIALSVFCSSCTPTAKLLYGVKEPKPVTMEYIEKRIIRYDLQEYKHILLDSLAWHNFFNGYLNGGQSDGQSVNSMIILNSEGVIYNSSIEECSSDIVEYMEIVKSQNFLNNNNFYEMGGLDILGETSNNIDHSPDEYIVLFTWATYIGRLNKKSTKNYVSSTKDDFNNHTCYYLNLDLIKR